MIEADASNAGYSNVNDYVVDLVTAAIAAGITPPQAATLPLTA